MVVVAAVGEVAAVAVAVAEEHKVICGIFQRSGLEEVSDMTAQFSVEVLSRPRERCRVRTMAVVVRIHLRGSLYAARENGKEWNRSASPYDSSTGFPSGSSVRISWIPAYHQK